MCAHGVAPTNKTDEMRKVTMSLWQFNTLDYISAAVLMHDLHGTPGQLATIQIANRCDPTFAAAEGNATDLCVQPVEIWDVRAIGATWQSDPDKMPRPWSSPDGKECPLARGFGVCMACRDSQSERGCRYRCSKGSHGLGYHLTPEEVDDVNYGQKLGSGIEQKVFRQGALGKAEAWRYTWESILVQLPRLPRAYSDDDD